MTWTALADYATGQLISAPIWNNILGASGNLEELKVHTHDGTNGDGAKLAGETPGRNPWLLGLA